MSASDLHDPSLLRARPPRWPIWHAPELGRSWLLGADFDQQEGFIAVRLSHRHPDDLEQVIIESRGALPSVKQLGWRLHQLEAARDAAGIDQIFSPMPKVSEIAGIVESRVSATLGASERVVGITLRLGRSSVSAFATTDGGSAVVLLRRGYALDAPMPKFDHLDNLSQAESRRQEVLRQLRGTI